MGLLGERIGDLGELGGVGAGGSCSGGVVDVGSLLLFVVVVLVFVLVMVLCGGAVLVDVVVVVEVAVFLGVGGWSGSLTLWSDCATMSCSVSSWAIGSSNSCSSTDTEGWCECSCDCEGCCDGFFPGFLEEVK